MATWLVSMVRNEQDVIEAFVRHHAAQVDGLLIADNLSSDHTRGILEDLADELPLVVVDDPDPAYRQAAKMTALAHRARVEFGAEWIIPADADEFWQAVDGSTIKAACEAQPDGVGILPVAIYDYVVTGREGFENMTHRRVEATPLHKVAVRAAPDLRIEMGNHQATYDVAPEVAWNVLRLRHFPIRTVGQYIRKARQGSAALRLTDLPEDAGQHWRDWDRLTDAQLAEAFAEHWTFDPDDPRVVCDPW